MKRAIARSFPPLVITHDVLVRRWGFTRRRTTASWPSYVREYDGLNPTLTRATYVVDGELWGVAVGRYRTQVLAAAVKHAGIRSLKADARLRDRAEAVSSMFLQSQFL